MKKGGTEREAMYCHTCRADECALVPKGESAEEGTKAKAKPKPKPKPKPGIRSELSKRMTAPLLFASPPTA